MDEKELAMYRVMRSGGMLHNAMEMTPEEAVARRLYIRRELKASPEWCNKPNESIDQITMYEVENGYLLEDEEGKPYYIPFGGISQAESAFRSSRSMMPFEFMSMTGKDFKWVVYRADVSEAKGIVNRFILNFGKFKEKGMGLYIYSRAKGSGKTMLACCILNEISMRYAGSVKFINVLDLMEMTKRGYKGGEDETQQLYQAGVLVIDDIGVQMSKEWVDSILYRLINSRCTNRLPTIYTSNVLIGNLKIDERIADRIESNTFAVQLPEEQIRKQEQEKRKAELMESIK